MALIPTDSNMGISSEVLQCPYPESARQPPGGNGVQIRLQSYETLKSRSSHPGRCCWNVGLVCLFCEVKPQPALSLLSQLWAQPCYIVGLLDICLITFSVTVPYGIKNRQDISSPARGAYSPAFGTWCQPSAVLQSAQDPLGGLEKRHTSSATPQVSCWARLGCGRQQGLFLTCSSLSASCFENVPGLTAMLECTPLCFESTMTKAPAWQKKSILRPGNVAAVPGCAVPLWG